MPNDYSDIAEYFREQAKEGYEFSNGRPYLKKEVEHLDPPKPLTELQQRFRDIRDSRIAIKATSFVLEKASDALTQIGLQEFSYVARGSSAICFTSNNQAIRAGIRTSKKPRRSEMGDIRDECPLVLQEDHHVHISKFDVRFEVLPFLAMIENSEIPEVFQNMIPKILHGTCFEVNNEDRDLAVLPDGTPIYVDPGAINLRKWKQQPTTEDFEKIKENTECLGWPEDLSWILPDGRFKQEQFFPKPVNPLKSTLQL